MVRASLLAMVRASLLLVALILGVLGGLAGLVAAPVFLYVAIWSVSWQWFFTGVLTAAIAVALIMTALKFEYEVWSVVRNAFVESKKGQ